MSNERVNQALDVRTEDLSNLIAIGRVKHFRQSIPEIERDFGDLRTRPVTERITGIDSAAYFVLTMSVAKKQKIKGQQIAQSIPGSVDDYFNEGLGELGEDSAQVQASVSTKG